VRASPGRVLTPPAAPGTEHLGTDHSCGTVIHVQLQHSLPLLCDIVHTQLRVLSPGTRENPTVLSSSPTFCTNGSLVRRKLCAPTAQERDLDLNNKFHVVSLHLLHQEGLQSGNPSIPYET
jgi:hypothetical protein